MANGDSVSQIQTIYIAYYGRPADPVGLAFWCGRLDEAGGNLDAIIDAFGSSAEFIDNYGDLNSTDLVNNLFVQIFGRNADQAGRDFFVGLLDSGVQSLASIALDIANGAQNDDLMVLENRREFAQSFTALIKDSGTPYAEAELADVKDLLSRVSGVSESVVNAGLYSNRLVDFLLGNPGTADDFSADPQTTGAVAIEFAVDGRIESIRDADWFEVELQAERSYRIELTGVSSDPVAAGVNTLSVSVFDADGAATGTTANALGQDPRTSQTFTPETSGIFYLAVEGNDYWQGNYVLSIDPIPLQDNVVVPTEEGSQQFEQEDFEPGVTRFTVTLDDLTDNGGTGSIQVDVDGDGVADETQATNFTDADNIRLQSIPILK